MDKLPGFGQFCDLTSLHGWKFFPVSNFKNTHVAFWSLIMCGSILGASYIITNHIQEFFSSSVAYNLESPTVPLDEVYFPSVTICNMNALRKSFIQSLMMDPKINQSISYSELWKLVDQVFIEGGKEELDYHERQVVKYVFDSPVYNTLYSEFVDNEVNRSDLPGLSNVPIFHWHYLDDLNSEERFLAKYKKAYISEIASQFRFQDLFVHLKFEGHGINHDGGGFSTDISETCHWLTPFVKKPGDPEGLDLRTNVPFARNGLNNGLQMLLDTEAYDYASTKYGSEGFMISVVHHLDIPIMKHTGVNIQPGQASHISVTPTLMTTTNGARTRFTPEKRQCYFEDEILLKHFPPKNSFRYEMSNCLFESTLQNIEATCKCVDKYFTDLIKDRPVCSGLKKLCMKNMKQHMGDTRTIWDRGERKPCLAACEDQKYRVLVTQAAYPNLQSFVRSEDFCLVYNKLLRVCASDHRKSLSERYPRLCQVIHDHENNKSGGCDNVHNHNVTDSIEQEVEGDLENFDVNFDKFQNKNLQKEIFIYARNNIAKVTVFLRDPYVKKYAREEKITQITFVGTVGGLLGLFLGFSFISAVEIFYLLALWIYNRMTSGSGVAPSMTPITNKQKAFSNVTDVAFMKPK